MELSLYHSLIDEIKGRIRQAQAKAAIAVNSELALMYFDIGKMILARQ